jgi:hypothetical protein
MRDYTLFRLSAIRRLQNAVITAHGRNVATGQITFPTPVIARVLPDQAWQYSAS